MIGSLFNCDSLTAEAYMYVYVQRPQTFQGKLNICVLLVYENMINSM